MTTQTKTTWQKVKLRDVASINPDSIGKSFAFEKILYTDISSVGTGAADSPTEMSFSEAPSRARRLVKDGDTILSTVRPNRRSFLYLKEPEENRVVSTGFAVLRAGDKIDPRFLYYLISNQPFTDYLTLHAKGAAYPAVDEEIIANADVVLPELNDQKQIADVLSTYDDLIENNTKRIKILEEMAQAIYKEWFVYFRFPGHEKVKMIDSKTEFGKIPAGWAVKNLVDKVNIFRGKNITKNTIVEGKNPVVAGGLGPAYFHNKANAEGPVITVSASGANAGHVNLYHEDIWASDCSYINKSSTPFVYYYYLLLKDRQIEVTGLQRGSAQPHVYPKDLARLSIADAPEELTRAFEEKANSLFGVINNLQARNQKLRQARDLLLPKLVTGDIEVK